MDTAPAPAGIGADQSAARGPSQAPAKDQVETRRLKWEAKQLDSTRTLGAWELYRALNDALDEGHDQFDLSNRDARLALILMGGLNAALVILASQTNRGAELSLVERQIEYGVIAIYALFAIRVMLENGGVPVETISLHGESLGCQDLSYGASSGAPWRTCRA